MKVGIVTFDLIEASDALVKTVRDLVFAKAGVPPREHPRRGVAQPLGARFREAGGVGQNGRGQDRRGRRGGLVAHAPGDRRLRGRRDRLRDQSPEGDRRPGGRPAQSRRPERSPGQGPPVRRRPVAYANSSPDACGLPPLLLHLGRQCKPPLPRGFSQDERGLPRRGQSFVEKVYDGQAPTLFLQGCSGDIRPNLPGDPYRCADEADIEWAGRDLGGATVRALAHSMIREERSKRPSVYKLRCVTERVTLPGKDGPVEAELMAMKIGPYLLLTMPGEPMVEYGFKLERSIAERAVPIVIGYANGAIGYIATEDAYKSGGYEPTQSHLLPAAEAEILMP